MLVVNCWTQNYSVAMFLEPKASYKMEAANAKFRTLEE